SHQGVIAYIMSYHRSGGDEGVTADVIAADDRRIGADGRAAPDHRWHELGFPRNIGARIYDISEDAARAAKYIVLEHNAFVDADVVLDLAAVPDHDTWPNRDVLSDRAMAPDRDVAEHMTEMPDRGVLADRHRFVDIRTFVDANAGKARVFAQLRSHCRRCLATNGWRSPSCSSTEAVRKADTISTEVRTSSMQKLLPATISS